MQFMLMGFTQEMGFRVFRFERMGADRTRMEYRVRADLALTRKYGIRVQELPLLCRRLLERSGESEQQPMITYTEADMRLQASDYAAARDAAAQKRKPPRRPHGENLGSAWRGPQP